MRKPNLTIWLLLALVLTFVAGQVVATPYYAQSGHSSDNLWYDAYTGGINWLADLMGNVAGLPAAYIALSPTQITPDVGDTSLSGEYTGDTLEHAQAAATAQKLAGANIIVVSEGPTTSDPDSKKVTFAYRYVDTNVSREVISYRETIGFKNAFTRNVAHEVLDGGNPMIQQTTLAPAYAWQRGRAVGRTGYPAFPTFAFFATSLEDGDTVEYESPERLANGLMSYPISWDRRFILATGTAIPAPGLPPTGGS